MKILVINAGSSSLKFQLIDMANESVLAKGIAERIGLDDPILTYAPDGKDKIKSNPAMKNHEDAVRLVLASLTDKESGVIADMSEIKAVGHRVVHGGESFSGSVMIGDAVMQTLLECAELAPLHNPANIMGIEACRAVMPDTPMAGVFDTAFHQTMPANAYIYALPYELYKKHQVRRYGFHGTSHFYVSQRVVEFIGKPIEELKIVTCHLGNGSSIAAVKYGKSVDTSMGFTPLEGVPMGTRSGDIDPAIIKYLCEKLNMSVQEVDSYLNKKSGVMGISGVSSDFRDIEAAAEENNEQAKLAQDVFAYRVKKYIGAYAAAMDGVDAIVFTAGVGENDWLIRSKVLSGLTYLGLEFDEELNASVRGKEIEITKPGCKTRAFIIPTNEELVIARDTLKLLQG